VVLRLLILGLGIRAVRCGSLAGGEWRSHETAVKLADRLSVPKSHGVAGSLNKWREL
jgi:hypothetical protein